MLYIFSQVAVQRKYDIPSTWDTTKSIIRSSFFIFFHAYNGSLIGCALRHTFGRFYYRVLVCLPALSSSYLSLLIEKPSRRQALAFYLLNMASEIVYRMLVTKGYFKPVKHGETLVFAFSLAAWYHYIKTEGFGNDPVSAAFKALIGREEGKRRARGKTKELTMSENQTRRVKTKLEKAIESFFDSNPSLKPGKHLSCTHQASSCLLYILNPIPSRFLIGYSIQSILGLSRRPLDLIYSPLDAIRQSLTSKASLRFGLFIAALVSGGRATSCLLRRNSNGDRDWHYSVSGFVAGLSMLLAPRSSLSMYVMWKAFEQYYLRAARQGKVKYFSLTISSIYALSAATILYTFALEPRFIRPSYMKFLDNVSDHRLHQLNRMVLDVFGTGSSVGYEDYFPDLDPRLMSNQFKELVFNWMIQPYE